MYIDDDGDDNVIHQFPNLFIDFYIDYILVYENHRYRW